MLKVTECLKELVGLSERTCNCYGERPTGTDVSLSGFYVDDPFEGVPLVFAEAALTCEDSLWPILAAARESAIHDFYQEFSVGFQNNRQASIQQFVGEMGEGEATGKVNKLLTITGPIAGARLTPKVTFRGAQISLTAIGLYLNTTGSYDVKIYDTRDATTALHTIEVPAEANKKSTYTLPEPIQLPLTDSATGQKITYLFVYDLNGARAWNVLWNCRCGGATRPWEAFLTGEGVSGPNSLNLNSIDTSYTNGLYITASIGCRNDVWICDAVKPGLIEDDFTIVMAKIIQLMAIRNVIKYATKAGKISYWTMLIEEKAPYEIKRLSKAIDWRLSYLYNNTPVWVSDCYICKDKIISKRSLIV